MRLIYSFVFYLILPFVFLRLYWRGRKNAAYRLRWAERLGFFEKPPKSQGIWVHAVSVGETIAAIPLIRQLQQRYPDKMITVTTMTPTGSERVQQVFGKTVFHVYLPYDIPDAVARFLNRIQPAIGIIMETELWPNLLTACGKRGIPLLIANARLSPRSSKGYAKIKMLTQSMLSWVKCVGAQTKEDGERFLGLGLVPDRLSILGNIKFDLELPSDLQVRADVLRSSWDKRRPTWIAASTHEGEDSIVLDAFAKILEHYPRALLILVPRHPERFDKVAELCEKYGFRIARRSQIEPYTQDIQIFLGDTLGELLLFYATSDVAFVGGSLIPVGGHNLLEPAALGVPSLTGGHMHNFTEIFRLMREERATIQVNDADELAKRVEAWFADPAERVAVGERGRAVVARNRGALERHLDEVAKLLGS